MAKKIKIYQTKNEKSVSDVFAEMIKSVKKASLREEGPPGIPSGFSEIDRILKGWKPSELIVVSAATGIGKTSFLMSLIHNAAVDHKRPVALFSLESSYAQTARLLISTHTGIPSDRLRTGKMTEQERGALSNVTVSLKKIYIDDTPRFSLSELRAKCRRLKLRHNIQMVVVDYLQLMAGDRSNGRYHGNREQEIASISRGLKAIAKELNIPVIAASQISRKVGFERPGLVDVEDGIAESANMVICLSRPEHYNIEKYSDGTSTKGVTEVIIAKNSSGRNGSVILRFDPKKGRRFSETP